MYIAFGKSLYNMKTVMKHFVHVSLFLCECVCVHVYMQIYEQRGIGK